MFRAKVYGVAGFDRQFAVKRFHAEFVKDPDTAAAISAAARTYGSLEHPRIARLHEYGVTGGHTFTATELIEGLDLSRLLSVASTQGKPLPSGAAAVLMSQAARTVGYAHGRGICHLGLCPTNLIVTPDGEVRVTDFGLLPARLPSQPAADASLRARLPYVAPEQVASEATSAATDVFQLGVIAYELLAGQQAFSGATSEEVAHKLLAVDFPPVKLPKPLVKVLQRCLARSPFERYPDARALADAIDAATRSASLPGSVHDLAAAVRAALEHLDTMGTEQVSGAVSFPLPAPPSPAGQRQATGDSFRAPQTTLRMPHLAPAGSGSRAPSEPPAPGDAVPEAADDDADAQTNPVRVPAASRPRQPPGEGGPAASSPPRPKGAPAKQTLRGVGAIELPPIKMPPLAEPADEADELDEDMPTKIRERDKGFVSVPVGRRKTTATPVAVTAVKKPVTPAASAGAPEPSQRSPSSPPTAASRGSPAAPPDSSGQAPVAPALDGDDTPAAGPGDSDRAPAVSPEGEVEAPPRSQASLPLRAAGHRAQRVAPPAAAARGHAPAASKSARSQSRRSSRAETSGVSPKVLEATSWEPLTPVPRDGVATASRNRRQQHQRAAQGPRDAAGPAARRRSWRWAMAVVILGGLGGGGYVLYQQNVAGAGAAVQGHAGDAGTMAALPGDASVPADARAPDAAVAEPPDARAQPISDKLTIRTKPRRARVYLDGSFMGKTPLTLDATADQHRLALIRAGYKLYTADIEGHGTIEVRLDEVVPPEGPAGIKVRCRRKNRYYVFVDDIATGQFCPTERIGVDLGPHTVEIYDPVTESRRDFRVRVKDTHLSLRVRVD